MSKIIRSGMHALLTLPIALALAACTNDTASPSDEPSASASTPLLFGLSEAQVLSLRPLASTPMTAEAWLAFHRQSFDCANYGDTCRAVGPEAAYRIMEQSYELGLEGGSRADVDAFLARELDAAALAWGAAHADDRTDARCSNVGTNTGGANEERVRTQVDAIRPAVGSWYVTAKCTYQKKGLFGVWGGNASAHLQATWSGHLHNSANQVYDDSGNYVTANVFQHELNTTKLYFTPDQSSDELHGFATCDASLGGWSASAATNCIDP
jgi:hypothetical protein